MKYTLPTSNEIAKSLVIKSLKDYAELLRKPKLSTKDIKTLRRLREAARLAKNFGI